MKKIISWGIYFLICGIVITAAIIAGKNHGHCYECEIAFGKKEVVKQLAGWNGFVLSDEEK
jgi:hypothetical protein